MSLSKMYLHTRQNFRRLYVRISGTRYLNFFIHCFYRFRIWKYETLHKRRLSEWTLRKTKNSYFFCDRTATPSVKQRISIIIPVFNAYTDLKLCLHSVINQTRSPYRLLIIDDGSTDCRIHPLLEFYADAYPHIRVVYNEKNLGYTATINKGCRMAAPDDVVLLNSDTQVTDNWLKKLNACATSKKNIATVTALSNAAGVFSVPCKNMPNEIPSGVSIDEMGALIERLSEKRRPAVPTGHGFCLYIRRFAIESVGAFDEKNFPRGYGEENDFCMRASKKGFIHLIDDSTYIYHRGTASFLNSKKKIMPECMHKLNRLHPEYEYLVMKWLIDDPLDPFRRVIKKTLDHYTGKNHESFGAVRLQ